MGLIRKLRGKFHDDWCSCCTSEMEVIYKQLYALPTMSVDHYVSHREPEYFKEHLVKVARKAEVPPGIYACGIVAYRCPECAHRAVRLTIFLPVRDQEKWEDEICFENGEMDEFIWGTGGDRGQGVPGQYPGSMGAEERIVGPGGRM